MKDILPESKENKEANDSTNNNDMRRPSIAALVAEAAQDSDDSEEVETAVENTSGDADEPMTSVDSPPSEHEQTEPNTQSSSVDERRTNGNLSHDDDKQETDDVHDETNGATKPETKVSTMIAGATAMDSPATPEPSLNTSTHVLKAEVHVLEGNYLFCFYFWFQIFVL